MTFYLEIHTDIGADIRATDSSTRVPGCAVT